MPETPAAPSGNTASTEAPFQKGQRLFYHGDLRPNVAVTFDSVDDRGRAPLMFRVKRYRDGRETTILAVRGDLSIEPRP